MKILFHFLRIYTLSQLKDESVVQLEDYMEGTLIRLNESYYAKVVKKKVIYYLIKNRRWIKTRPIPIEESEYVFPPGLVGVFQVEDDIFFFRKLKYCHRLLSDFKKVRTI